MFPSPTSLWHLLPLRAAPPSLCGWRLATRLLSAQARLAMVARRCLLLLLFLPTGPFANLVLVSARPLLPPPRDEQIYSGLLAGW
jgi:hypothetical protein